MKDFQVASLSDIKNCCNHWCLARQQIRLAPLSLTLSFMYDFYLDEHMADDQQSLVMYLHLAHGHWFYHAKLFIVCQHLKPFKGYFTKN